MQIGELAKRTALTVDAIRLYERRRLLPKATRSTGGFRFTPRMTSNAFNSLGRCTCWASPCERSANCLIFAQREPHTLLPTLSGRTHGAINLLTSRKAAKDDHRCAVLPSEAAPRQNAGRLFQNTQRRQSHPAAASIATTTNQYRGECSVMADSPWISIPVTPWLVNHFGPGVWTTTQA